MRGISFKRHRFAPDAIRYAVWLYHRFTMGLRVVEDLLAQRGIDMGYETARCRANIFGPANCTTTSARPEGMAIAPGI